MVEARLTLDSMRARKARLGSQLTWAWRSALMVLAVVMILGGLTLVLAGYAIGWLVFSLTVAPIMLLEWWRGELKDAPIEKNATTIDGILASDALGQLRGTPTPKDIATITGKTQSGQFFAGRYGIGARFLQEIASDNPQDATALWQEAQATCERTGSPTITGAVLVVALIRCFANYESLLAHMQLSPEDLDAGVRWYDHIQSLVQKHSEPRRTGGIARDWSFGYVPTLTRFAQNLSEQVGRGRQLNVDLVGHQQAIDQMIATFSGGGRQNVALIGPTGAGKTTIVSVFAERLMDGGSSRVPETLKFRQVFMLDAGSLIAAAPGRGELERLVMQVLGEAYSAKNIIVCLDNAQLFFEEGVGSIDLSNVLLPLIEAGRLKIIFAMDEQRFLQISARNSSLANALNRVSVTAASKEETIEVMQDQLILSEYQKKVTYMYQSLEEAYRLSERYIHDLAMPGRALKLLDSAASYAEDGFVTQKSVQQAIEQTMDVKIGVASGEEEREKLLHLEDLIHKRMINQTRAVRVVSDALRRARTGVRNQNRPIGTFLFLGPTGVGKTELAKALADVYFGGESRIVRLDLNEFVRADDVSRLLADGANDPLSLTAQIMKQPFSVVLLDEIEKAHPQVLTTLLQLLDEGILRDEKNREVSFRDAIIIATSNAGADRIREYIERGYQLEQFEEQLTSELINTNQFRPEFLNRFDEMVIFRPLNKEELLQVVDLILAGINKNLALQKVAIDVEMDAKRFLVDAGYDPRLGARPMRRVIQRAVENTVAKLMLSGQAIPGQTIQITLSQVQQALGAADQPSLSNMSSSQQHIEDNSGER